MSQKKERLVRFKKKLYLLLMSANIYNFRDFQSKKFINQSHFSKIYLHFNKSWLEFLFIQLLFIFLEKNSQKPLLKISVKKSSTENFHRWLEKGIRITILNRYRNNHNICTSITWTKKHTKKKKIKRNRSTWSNFPLVPKITKIFILFLQASNLITALEIHSEGNFAGSWR